MIDDNKNISVIKEELRIIEYANEDIKNLIYTVRGKQVMLDSDVAMLYHYPTKRINETVRRNKNRFPENFCFQLKEEEIENLRSQFATSLQSRKNILSDIPLLNFNFRLIFLKPHIDLAKISH